MEVTVNVLYRLAFFLSLSEYNNELVLFLCSGKGQNIITNKAYQYPLKAFSIDIFYDNFNSNENFYSFLLSQQDQSKQVIPKRISCPYSFEKYIRNYLSFFSVEEAEKVDLLSNKNSKYLLYKFNDWIESLVVEKILIRNSSKSKENTIDLDEIEKIDNDLKCWKS